MIDLTDVNEYCESEKVKTLALYCKDKIKQNDDTTYAFVYAGFHGMQFEDENDERYIELNISDEGKDIHIYIHTHDGRDSEINLKVDEAIEKWNELF